MTFAFLKSMPLGRILRNIWHSKLTIIFSRVELSHVQLTVGNWCHTTRRSWSSLVQVKACRVVRPSHYLNHRWLVADWTLWNIPQCNVSQSADFSVRKMDFKCRLQIASHFGQILSLPIYARNGSLWTGIWPQNIGPAALYMCRVLTGTWSVRVKYLMNYKISRSFAMLLADLYLFLQLI